MAKKLNASMKNYNKKEATMKTSLTREATYSNKNKKTSKWLTLIPMVLPSGSVEAGVEIELPKGTTLPKNWAKLLNSKK